MLKHVISHKQTSIPGRGHFVIIWAFSCPQLGISAISDYKFIHFHSTVRVDILETQQRRVDWTSQFVFRRDDFRFDESPVHGAPEIISRCQLQVDERQSCK